MVQKKVTVKNATGLHLNPAGVLCDAAINYKCKVEFKFQDSISNAKSILSVLGACVKCGDEIELMCDGTDENEALEFLTNLIDSGLGE